MIKAHDLLLAILVSLNNYDNNFEDFISYEYRTKEKELEGSLLQLFFKTGEDINLEFDVEGNAISLEIFNSDGETIFFKQREVKR